MALLKDAVAWVQERLPTRFWSSWEIELFYGALLLVLCRVAVGGYALPVAIGVSLFYERFADPNGWNIVDVGQRFCGIAAAEILWRAL